MCVCVKPNSHCGSDTVFLLYLQRGACVSADRLEAPEESWSPRTETSGCVTEMSPGSSCSTTTTSSDGEYRAGQGRAGQDRTGQGRAGQGRAGQGRAGQAQEQEQEQGRAGQGRAGQEQGRLGQDRAGQGRAGPIFFLRLPVRKAFTPSTRTLRSSCTVGGAFCMNLVSCIELCCKYGCV